MSGTRIQSRLRICVVRLYKGYIYLSLSIYLTCMPKFMVLKISFGFLFPPLYGCGRSGSAIRVLMTRRSIVASFINQIIHEFVWKNCSLDEVCEIIWNLVLCWVKQAKTFVIPVHCFVQKWSNRVYLGLVKLKLNWVSISCLVVLANWLGGLGLGSISIACSCT